MSESVTIQVGFRVTNEMINNLFTTAFYGSISYWCRSVIPQVQANPSQDVPINECISNGITVKFISRDSDESWDMTKEDFVQGVYKYYENNPTANRDISELDAEAADQVVQYALFGKLIFG